MLQTGESRIIAAIGLRWALVLGACLMMALAASPLLAVAEPPPWIGGASPGERPEGAPVIDKAEKSEAWRRRQVRGITPPVPADIEKMLQEQGNWHTPFGDPNAPGEYDLRGLYAGGESE